MNVAASASYVIAPPAVVSVPVTGKQARFPVHSIYCVGRNYAAHAIEMGGDPNREPPFFFQKNPDNLVLGGGDFPYPPKSSNVHFEIEMVVAIGEGGKDIPVEKALQHVYGYAIGIDMTRRDLQDECKKVEPSLGDRQGVRAFRAHGRHRACERRSAIPARARSG